MSTIFREREREREWDTESRGGRSYTTVRRYKIPERTLDDDIYEEQTRIVRRERSPSPARSVREVREYHVERDVERRAPRSDTRETREVREIRYVDERSPSPPRREVREYRFEREVSRSPSPVTRREYVVEREVEREPVHQPYDLERYSKSTEYFARPEPAQPIIIRNEAPQPIIIKEQARPQQVIVRREEPSFEIIERTEVAEDRQVARREPRRDEDYYYERRVREVDRGGRPVERSYDEREYDRGRYDERAYSDDDVVVIRKEKDTWGRDSSPHHRRHLAEGVIAGVGAAELIRHHRKKQGEEPGHHARQAIGYGALGAVGAEAISRFRRSHSRSRSSSREGRRRHRRRGRSKSRSLSRGKALAAVGGLAAIGALAYAAGKRGSNQQTTVIEDRRSRSRRRRHSVSGATVTEETTIRTESKHRDPEHRNRRIAQGGLATAAIAGLARARSQSRKGKSRSRSRVKAGVPIAAAGLAGAAVTGLYERHKAKSEEKAAERAFSRSRSRSRSVVYSSRPRGSEDVALVEYGGDPIYTDADRTSRHHRSRSRDYDPADYRSRRRSRRRHSSSSSARSRSRSRSKSRARNVAGTAAIAGVAGLAAHEAAKRRDKKKAEKAERERQRNGDGSIISDGYGSPGPDSTYGSQYPPPSGRYYPETNDFPPPPTGDYAAQPAPYNPADYPPPPGVGQAPYGYAPTPQGAREADHYETRRYRGDENVREPTPSLKSVQFDLEPEDDSSTPRRRSSDPGHQDEDELSRNERGRRRGHGGDGHDSRRSRSDSPSSISSGETIELPERFDKHGRPKGSDAMADKVEEILSGKGSAGKLFQKLTGDLFSGAAPSSRRR